MHIVIDRFYQREKMLLKTGSKILSHVQPSRAAINFAPGRRREEGNVSLPTVTPGGLALTSQQTDKTYGPMASELFKSAAAPNKAEQGEKVV